MDARSRVHLQIYAHGSNVYSTYGFFEESDHPGGRFLLMLEFGEVLRPFWYASTTLTLSDALLNEEEQPELQEKM